MTGHGCADPKLCPDCRRAAIGPASDDPDIRQRWAELREGLALMLRPYVQEHLVDELARRAVAELVAGPGWKPPLRPAPDWRREGRIERYLAATDPGNASRPGPASSE
ncbi:hypothetical protein ACIBG7_43100 [Nonomuraea sp. NPDC050328]|uniref:hypothetical protein n=1 Tax=Nonomuraea sp. NPDC050328 TaxID=3364361 RepID=UPI0037BB09EC